MNFRTLTTLFIGLSVVVLFAAAPAQAVPCDACGPGAHWIDTCTLAGQDDLGIDGAVIGIDTDLDCIADTSLILNNCGSPQLVNRSTALDDSVNYPGTRPVDLHLDVIDTEVADMCLTDGTVTMIAGAGLGQSGVLQPTLGTIAEQLTDDAVGDSFFDFMFEIDLGAGNYVYNQTALRMSAVGDDGITCVPPDDSDYFHPIGCTPLFDAPVGGTLVANLVMAHHYVDYEPPIGACCASHGDGDPCLLLTERLCTWTPEHKNWVYYGDGSTCAPNPCDTGTPAVPTVSGWGIVVVTLLAVAAGTIMLNRRRRLAA